MSGHVAIRDFLRIDITFCAMRRPLPELRRAIDPRLEWVHDKDIGPDRDQQVEVGIGITWWIRAGGVNVRTARGEWRVGPGDWVFLLPGRRHQAFLPGTRMWSFGYRFGRPRGTPWYLGPEVLVLRDCRALERTGRALLRLVEGIARTRRIGWAFDFACTPMDWLRIDAAFRLWLAEAVATCAARGIRLASGAPDDERVSRALSLIERDPWGPASDPLDLAAAVGVSRRRLEQLFAAAVGHGVAHERDRMRLERAQELLAHREWPVKQIASRLGFANGPAFSVWFRRHAGMPPRLYRSGGRTVA